MFHILLIDDEAPVLRARAAYLQEQDCTVDQADNAADALLLVSRTNYDAVLLDVVMPEKVGFDLIGELKQITDAPIIFLSGMVDTDYQLKGFAAGAADYITKDIPLSLFWVKVKSRIELSRGEIATILSYPPLRLDLKKHSATIDDINLLLTTTEFQILALLASKPMTIWSVDAIYRKIWGEYGQADIQLVQTHMSRMRRKLEKVYPLHDFLVTVWGKGYEFIPKDSANIF